MKRTRWLVVFLVIGLLVLGSSFAFAEGKRFEGLKCVSSAEALQEILCQRSL